MKKEEIIDLLLDYVKKQKLKKGDKLPSERDLSFLLKTSRATVREAVNILEERGVLIVKMGSGIFLTKSLKAIDSLNRLKNLDEEAHIKKQLEAYLMIAPIIIGRAAALAEEPEIEDLQECIVKMSRAIVTKEIEALVEADNEFHYILALMTKNYSFVKIMDDLNFENRSFWEYFMKNDEFVNNVIFAGYIEIVNAVKQKNSIKAYKKTKNNIYNFCRLFSEIKNTDYCADLTDLLQK